jgi:AhpC/TSA family protein
LQFKKSVPEAPLELEGLTRMTRIGWSPSLNLRQLYATASAVLAGVVSLASNRSRPLTMLRVGDAAPDFTLSGSDGRTHALHDHIGVRPVVLAWFPKAFTGG